MLGMGRPLLKYGSYGPDVLTVQQCLNATPFDSDFGSMTESAVEKFQRQQHLSADGIVGTDTWTALEQEFDLPPYPPPMFPTLSNVQITAICDVADKSKIASYNWHDRGTAPTGYTRGMALAWSTVYRKWLAGDSSVLEMAKANTGDDAKDAISWYNSNFNSIGMHNDEPGADTLRHLFVLLMGLGVRESSGQHCEGRDQSASNTSSDTAEAGLFQQSANSLSASPEMQKLYDEYLSGGGLDGSQPLCALDIFAEDVSCSSSDWGCYGSGKGFNFQTMCKHCPQFAVEVCAIGLRVLKDHWGPIKRKEAELRTEADDLFRLIQRFLDEAEDTPVA
jgi:peptidoglycan hydrolase-like protein with peptidoglycan-binding domain